MVCAPGLEGLVAGELSTLGMKVAGAEGSVLLADKLVRKQEGRCRDTAARWAEGSIDTASAATRGEQAATAVAKATSPWSASSC